MIDILQEVKVRPEGVKKCSPSKGSLFFWGVGGGGQKRMEGRSLHCAEGLGYRVDGVGLRV